MRIRDIELQDVAAGKNWRIVPDDTSFFWREDVAASGRLLEDLQIETITNPSEDDYIVYSAVSVPPSGRVQPMLLIRRLGDLDYGGDYCEFHRGNWRKLGSYPDSEFEAGDEYIADPLDSDMSFESDDGEFRTDTARQFRAYSRKLGIPPRS